jgi:hypothetical protein
MTLTTAQRTTLKADILANPDALAIYEIGDLQALADLYNQPANPAYVVWRTDVSTVEIRAVLVWSEYDVLSVSKQNAFSFLCSNHVVNAALPNVRAGISSIFGAPQQSGNLAALVAIAKRNASRLERLFATGTGSTAVPGTMAVEGVLTFGDLIGL